MELLHFCGDGLSEPFHQPGVPGLCQSGSHREGGAVLEIEIGIVVVSHRLQETVFQTAEHADAIDTVGSPVNLVALPQTQTSGAVGHNQRLHTKFCLQCLRGLTGRTGNPDARRTQGAGPLSDIAIEQGD